MSEICSFNIFVCFKSYITLLIFLVCPILLQSKGNAEFSEAFKMLNAAAQRENDIRNAITMIFIKNGSRKLKTLKNNVNNVLTSSGCSSNDKFAIILHGWIQSCDDDWSNKLIDRLAYYRGGCILCIDYSKLAYGSYIELYKSFSSLTDDIVLIVLMLIKEGVQVNKAYMFGFSFGGQLASAVGRSLSPHYVFKNIDTCDMAGPGFDGSEIDHRQAAQHVQCFHSSRDKGTKIYSCHKNIILGNCGYSQPAAMSQHQLGSHGLCLNIYINSFDYSFYALTKTSSHCQSIKPSSSIPTGYKIGYNEKSYKYINGTIFVPTSLNFPYNLSKMELSISYF